MILFQPMLNDWCNKGYPSSKDGNICYSKNKICLQQNTIVKQIFQNSVMSTSNKTRNIEFSIWLAQQP